MRTTTTEEPRRQKLARRTGSDELRTESASSVCKSDLSCLQAAKQLLSLVEPLVQDQAVRLVGCLGNPEVGISDSMHARWSDSEPKDKSMKMIKCFRTHNARFPLNISIPSTPERIDIALSLDSFRTVYRQRLQRRNIHHGFADSSLVHHSRLERLW